MKTEFSESTYAFAVTRDLVGGMSGPVVGAPEIPTLRKEGSSGGGYDVKIPFKAVAVFLQFKVPQVLVRGSNLMPPKYNPPYYRISLRTKQPNQHKMLLDLESQEKFVFYTAPEFHTSHELDRHYGASAVASHSAFFLPSDIGPLDGSSHHIAYSQSSTTAWCRSELIRIERQLSAEEIFRSIRNAVKTAPERRLDEFMTLLAQTVINAFNRHALSENALLDHPGQANGVINSDERLEAIPEERIERIKDGGLLQVAEIARNRLGCELIIFGEAAS